MEYYGNTMDILWKYYGNTMDILMGFMRSFCGVFGEVWPHPLWVPKGIRWSRDNSAPHDPAKQSHGVQHCHYLEWKGIYSVYDIYIYTLYY
jgi:hypothetical protein